MLYFYLGTIWRRADDDFTKLIFVLQAIREAHRVGEFIAGGCGFCAKLATRYNHALATDGIDNFRNRYTQVSEAIGFDPDTHRIITGAEDIDSADALDAGQSILDINQRIVTQEVLIEAWILCSQRNQHEDIGQRFFRGHAEARNLRRKFGGGGSNAILGKYRIQVRVGARFEGNLDSHGAIVGVDGLHVDHVVDTVDFLLQRRRYRLFDTHRVGTGVGGSNLDDGRRNIGILFGG